MNPTDRPDRVAYRLIVLRQDGSEILSAGQSTPFILPEVKTKPWLRVAESLIATLHEKWGVETFCLFAVQIDKSASIRHYAMCLCRDCELTGDARWVSIRDLKEGTFQAKEDYIAVEQTLEKCGNAREPFAQLRWFEELRTWAKDVIRPLGLELTGSFRQLNASPTFSLVRCETSGPAVWFKAVGKPNAREFEVTLKLAQLFASHCPQLIGVHRPWHGWLSLEAEGTQLSGNREISRWQGAAAQFAELQTELIGQAQQFLDCGARNVTIPFLRSHVSPLFSEIGEAMQRQTKTSPSPLTSKEILSLEKRIYHALDLHAALKIPDTLGHLDLNPENIVFSETGCTFLDWAEAYVGNPFLSLEYLVEHSRRTSGVGTALEEQTRRAYASCWNCAVSSQEVIAAQVLSPLLAVFAYAVVTSSELKSSEHNDPGAGAFLRALGRRMKTQADKLMKQEAVCFG